MFRAARKVITAGPTAMAFLPEAGISLTGDSFNSWYSQEMQGNCHDLLWRLSLDVESSVRRERFSQLPGKPRATVLKRTLTTAFPDLPRPGLGGEHKPLKTLE